MFLETNRKFDTSQEAIVSRFLHEKFFRVIDPNAEMVRDRNRQLAGIDEIVLGKKVDIKAQSSKKYLNSPTNTFILEVNSLKINGEPNIGWYLNGDLETEQYLFCWIPKCRTNEFGAIEKPEDIEEAEVMLVDRQKLHDYINQNYINDQYMLEQVVPLRNGNIDRDSIYIRDGMKLRCSRQIAEMPVVLVTPKYILSRCAVYSALVHQENVQKI